MQWTPLICCLLLMMASRVTGADWSSLAITYNYIGYNEDQTFRTQVTITNPHRSHVLSSDQNITIYACLIRLIMGSREVHGVSISTEHDVRAYHVDGCAHKIVFGPSFSLPAGRSVTLNLTQQYWMVAYTDVMPNWYIRLSNQNPILIGSTRDVTRFTTFFPKEHLLVRTAFDKVIPWTPEKRYLEHSRSTRNMDSKSVSRRLVPAASNALDLELNQFIGPYRSLSDVSVAHVLNSSFSRDEHQIEIGRENPVVKIIANSESSFLIGQATVQQLLERFDGSLPIGKLPVNRPRFGYRGMVLDIARHFHGKEEIIKLINLMWRYKLNTLQIHLAEDEAWALEIEGIPELTEIGASQCFDSERCAVYPQLGRTLDSGRHYLKKQEYIDIVRYANSKGITVIPEVDVPAHSTAAISAMKIRTKRLEALGKPFVDYRLDDPMDTTHYISAQYFTKGVINPCIDTTYAFIDQLIKTFKAYHTEAGQDLEVIHLGGDEVASAWDNSTACKTLIKAANESLSYVKKQMLRRLGLLAQENKVSLGFWEDGLMNEKNEPIALKEDLFPGDVTVYAYTWQTVWNWGGGSRPYALANANYKVILTPATFFYLDHSQAPYLKERGYYWATRYVDLKTVFSFRPDDIYGNIYVDQWGNPLDRESFCNNSQTKCPALRKPENIIGGQATLFSETIFNGEHIDNNVWPRLMAVSERLWKVGRWEKSSGESIEFKEDFNMFMNALSSYEIPYLERSNVNYYLSPPGVVKLEESTRYVTLKVNTQFFTQRVWLRYPGHVQEVISNVTLPKTCASTVFFSTSDKLGRRFSHEIPYNIS